MPISAMGRNMYVKWLFCASLFVSIEYGLVKSVSSPLLEHNVPFRYVSTALIYGILFDYRDKDFC